MKSATALILLVVALVVSGQQETTQTPEGDCPQTTPEENLKLALAFYEKLIDEQDFSVVDQYVSDGYIQHNPWVADGKEGLRTDLAKALADGTPKGSLEILRTASQGDLVWLHSKTILFGKPHILADIIRFECGKAVEHWDVIQEMVPSTKNDHPYV